MGGSCLEHLNQEGGPYQEGAIFASLLRGEWKIMIGQNKNNYTANLFNVKNDVGENHDLAAANPAKVRELMGAIMAMAKTAGVAHDRDPIDPKSNPLLHGGAWVPWDDV
jgi:arylsulfatase A-like enzyme